MSSSKEVDVPRLHKNLIQMPVSMRAFSLGLRRLYAQDAVSMSDSAASFRKIRDQVRADAAVYSTKVLPLANEVVGNISAYFDNYVALEYDDWVECLDEIIQEVESYEQVCHLLQHMHETIIVSLKQRQDEAEVSIIEMNKLCEEMKAKVDELNAEAEAKKDAAKTWGFVGDVTSVFTGGTSKVIIETTVCNNLRAEAKEKMAQAIAENKNAEIAKSAAKLTKEELMPALENFLRGVQVCNAFFVETKEELHKMSNSANNAADKKREDPDKKMKKEFLTMKKNAKEINDDCKVFFGAISEVIYIKKNINYA